MSELHGETYDPLSDSPGEDTQPYTPTEQEEVRSLSDDPKVDAQLRGQKIQIERSREDLSDFGRDLLG